MMIGFLLLNVFPSMAILQDTAVNIIPNSCLFSKKNLCIHKTRAAAEIYSRGGGGVVLLVDSVEGVVL